MTSSSRSTEVGNDDRDGPPVIGVTGVVAAGKSSLARLLATLGAHVIDVDLLGHVALARPDVVEEVVALLGDVTRAADGTLDNGVIAARVFDQPETLRRLEAIVHPRVRTDLDIALGHAYDTSPRAIVIDAALLFEGGLDALCDATVCVDAPRELRIARAERARRWSADEVARREARQLPASEKRARASRVVTNDGRIEALLGAATALLDEFAPDTAHAASDQTEDER